MISYWVICEPMKEDTEDCGHRWIAFPASEETLEDVIKIAKIGGEKVWIAKEGRMTNGIFRI